jgi:hypothetical protein
MYHVRLATAERSSHVFCYAPGREIPAYPDDFGPDDGFELMTKAEMDAALASVASAPEPHRVSKDTIIGRVVAAGKLADVMGALAAQTAEQQFIWNNSLWFWSNNATLRELCQNLGMDPDVILDTDPYV